MVKSKTILGEKPCIRCGIIKPIGDFYPNKTYKDGSKRYSSACKSCYPDQQRKYRLVSKFGITEEQYEEMLVNQNGVCAICGGKNIYGDGERRLAVDHCHKTGKVRGLLCQTCNRVLGLVKDSVEILNKSKEYLENNIEA